MNHFAIFQIWGLGDLVMTTPVIAEFRRLHPTAKLTIVVRGRVQAALLKDSPHVDAILDMGQAPGILEMIRFFISLRKQHIDVAYIGTRIAWHLPFLLRTLSGISTVVGDGATARWLYTHCNTLDGHSHRVDRMLDTFSMWSGLQPPPASFPLPISESSRQKALSIVSDSGFQAGKYIVIHPGSSTKTGTQKRLPPALARRVIAGIRSISDGPDVAVLFGPDELDLVPEFSDCGPGVVLLESLPLDVVHAVLANASGFIGTDSALGHIAAAFGVPTLTLAGPTNPAETSPYGPKALVITREPALPCQPCWGTPSFWKCPIGVQCMNELPESKILDVVRQWCIRRDEE